MIISKELGGRADDDPLGLHRICFSHLHQRTFNQMLILASGNDFMQYEIAVIDNNLKLVCLLIFPRSDLDCLDPTASTPLHLAVQNDNIKEAEYLHNNGTNLNKNMNSIFIEKMHGFTCIT